MAGFCISFTGEQISKPGFKDAIQDLMNAGFAHMNDEQARVAKELNVSDSCASDVVYLRTRSRWTQELEETLIALHAAQVPPNIMEFGCTTASAEALMNKVHERLLERSLNKEF
jgi:hypothetical protein